MTGPPPDPDTTIRPPPPPAGPRALSLRAVGDGVLESIALPAEGSVVIGRGAEADLRIEDPSLSRKHAMVTVGGGQIRIKDLGSANGTRLGDRTLEPGESVELQPGEVADLGSIMVIVQRGFDGKRPRRLLPHGYFTARLEEECERAARTGAGFVVARLHVAGDPAAAHEALSDALRGSDVAAQYVPDEYEVLLPATTIDQAAAMVARVAYALVRHGLEVRHGLAAYPKDGRDADALIAAAGTAANLKAEGDAPSADAGDDPSLVVADPHMDRIVRLVRRIAPGQISVLILGETGAGKEVVAELVHKLSPRAAAPFLRLNCGGFTESLLESELFGHEKGAFTGAVAAKPGLLESADGGTVFLDEIGELSPALQVRLLRVLEDRQVTRVGALKPRTIDVRFVAATNRNLEDEVAAGGFREDLYYRVSGIQIVIPPLRERTGAILPLAKRFIAVASKHAGRRAPVLSPAAAAYLEAQPWPGNIRELRNVIDRAVLLCGTEGTISEDHLHHDRMVSAPRAKRTSSVGMVAPGSLKAEVDEVEKRRVVEALDSCAGNQTRAAAMLGISRNTLAARMEQFGIARPRKR